MSKLRFLSSIKQNQLWPVLPHAHRSGPVNQSGDYETTQSLSHVRPSKTWLAPMQIIATQMLRNNVIASRLQWCGTVTDAHITRNLSFLMHYHVCRLHCISLLSRPYCIRDIVYTTDQAILDSVSCRISVYLRFVKVFFWIWTIAYTSYAIKMINICQCRGRDKLKSRSLYTRLLSSL